MWLGINIIKGIFDSAFSHFQNYNGFTVDTWKRHLNTTCNHFAQYSPNLIADTFQHTFSGDMGIQIYIKL